MTPDWFSLITNLTIVGTEKVAVSAAAKPNAHAAQLAATNEAGTFDVVAMLALLSTERVRRLNAVY